MLTEGQLERIEDLIRAVMAAEAAGPMPDTVLGQTAKREADRLLWLARNALLEDEE